MLFPKPQTKKKRKKHRESLLQNKESRICYLCARGGDYSWKQVLEEHHIFGGPNRHLSEEYGLKVYICPECHRTSARAVHQDPAGEANRYLQAAWQKAFEENFPELSFREIFGKNYL